MRMRNDAANIIERNPTHLLPILRHGEKATMDSHMQAVCGKINHTLHD